MKTGIVTTLIALCLPVSVLPPRCGFQPMSIFWYSTVKGFQLSAARCGQH